jgi:hypothetical protein
VRSSKDGTAVNEVVLDVPNAIHYEGTKARMNDMAGGAGLLVVIGFNGDLH